MRASTDNDSRMEPERAADTRGSWMDASLPLIHRCPPEDAPERWVWHRIGGRDYRVALPITFTPYAAVRACSARCLFCSENLRIDGETPAARLRPLPNYFDALTAALAQLHGLPLSYSLSGLETTDDLDWCQRLLETLRAAERDGLRVEDRVLYTNGAGFAKVGGDALAAAFAGIGLSWVELSRHHHDALRNAAIMRFRGSEPVASDDGFASAVARLRAHVPLRLVCIVQRGGIEDAAGVDAYLQWAQALGASTVIFREFSRLDARYRDNATRRYTDAARVSVTDLLTECLHAGRMRSPTFSVLTPEVATEGYYFRNVRLRLRDGMAVVFEASDYARMHQQHASGALYKLVFHANGRLCAGWSPDRDVLWEYADDLA